MLELKQDKKTFLDSLKAAPISFWIDSSGGPSEYCKNSFYGIDPKYYFYGCLDKVYFCRNGDGAMGRTGETAYRRDGVNYFDLIEEKLKEEKENKDGIFVGYIAYDMDFFFAYFDKTENITNSVIARFAGGARSVSNKAIFKTLGELCSNMTDSEYLKKVKLIKEEIRAGNVYQVNLTREYSIEVEKIDELDLYLKLREASPNPYGCFFKTPFVTILSSSPEEFLHVEPAYRRDGVTANRTIRTRPIKGTLSKDVFDIDPKNQAENIMIVDLERNDLGRICEYGSVTAKKLLEIESYKYLNHVVSTVEGKLRNDVRLRDIFKALFPGGSITGAPKISAMKLIDRIEPTKRGAYTGSFGYIKTNGEMNFNILIRTIFIQPNTSLRGGSESRRSNLLTQSGSRLLRQDFVLPRNDTFRVTFNVGGGIVADSDPQSELEEIKLKARGILQTIGIKSL